LSAPWADPADKAGIYPAHDDDWHAWLSRHSLGWVTGRSADGQLAGFASLTWDGGVHVFLLDTLVAVSVRLHTLSAGVITLKAGQDDRFP
jgi:hypothetical protein